MLEFNNLEKVRLRGYDLRGSRKGEERAKRLLRASSVRVPVCLFLERGKISVGERGGWARR